MINPTCQHRHISNATRKCKECGEQMIGVTYNVETVLDAPNLAVCTNPACSGDIEDPNCHNPHGTYIPDVNNQREVPIAYHYEYECLRCNANAETITYAYNYTTWSCGGDHRGEVVPV